MFNKSTQVTIDQLVRLTRQDAEKSASSDEKPSVYWPKFMRDYFAARSRWEEQSRKYPSKYKTHITQSAYKPA